MRRVNKTSPAALVGTIGALAVMIAACSPSVRVEAPREPITINLNVKLDADVRLRLLEDAKEDVDESPIF